jgi:hypothetical protein
LGYFFSVSLGLLSCKAGALSLEFTSSLFALVILEMGGSHALFAWAGLELQSSQSQLPVWLGLQVGAVGAQLIVIFCHFRPRFCI